MKPLKLAVFSYHTCPLAFREGKETGGLNIYVYETSKYLASCGIQVDVFTRSQDKTQPHIIQVAPGFRLIHIVAGPEAVLSKVEMFKHLKEFYENVLEFCKKDNIEYDLIHAHYYMSGIAGLWFKKQFSIPLITTFHTLGLMKNLVARDPSEIATPERIQAEFELVQKSDLIASSSTNDSKYIAYLYDCPPEKIRIVSPGVNTTLFAPQDKLQAKSAIGAVLNEKIILAVGRTEQLKGFDVLLYALKILFARHPNLTDCVSVWIVGGIENESPTPATKRLNEVKKLLGLASSVNSVNQVTQDKLPLYYNAADLVVMPSHYESFGMVALEALSCGTPVIATNVSGISQIISHGYHGFVTSAQNPLLLAHQLKHILLQDNFDINRSKIRDLAKQYTWEKTGKKLMNAYFKLCVIFKLHEVRTAIANGSIRIE